MWQIKEMIALAMLAVSAYTDIKERNIYLLPLIVSSTAAVSISVISYICSFKGDEMEILMYDIVLPIVTGIVFIVITKKGHLHMGSGDGCLLAALGLVIGIRYNLLVTAIGFMTAAVYACAVLMTRRKHRRKSIPFAPFLMTAFVLVLINEI
ncbi:MAG: A24 family peptidase [Lachnospiraceae bacterium]|nr:A24 family peptidase [Lachnospiraceae bacterium]